MMKQLKKHFSDMLKMMTKSFSRKLLKLESVSLAFFHICRF